MRLLLFIIAAMFAAQSANAQSLWRNFFTTNRNPIVEVVAGSNATVQASTVGVNLRRFTVNSIPGGTTSAQTNISWTAITNVDQIQIPLAGITNANHVTNWALVPTNYVPLEAQHATNADFAVYATNSGFATNASNATNAEFVTTATLTNQIYASNVVSGGQITVTALASNTPSASQVLTATSVGSAAWQTPSATSSHNPKQLFTALDDFINAVGLSTSARSGPLDMIQAVANTGTASPVNWETNAPGIFRLSTAANASGGAVVNRGYPYQFLDYSLNTNEWRIRINQLPSGTEKYNAWVGYASYFNSEPPADCVQIVAQTNYSTFLFRARNNNSLTAVDSGVTVDTGWHTFKIITHFSTNALLYVDGVYKTNITSNIPTARPVQYGIGIYKAVGTTPATIDIDYAYEAIDLINTR